MSSGCRRPAAPWALLIALFGATAAAAGPDPTPRAVAVTASGCGELDAHEIENLIDLEISTSARLRSEASVIYVHLECRGGRARIVARERSIPDPLEREIPSPAEGEAGAERELALAIAQLFETSWPDLVAPQPEPPPPPAAEGPGAHEEPASGGGVLGLEVGAGARWRAISRSGGLAHGQGELGIAGWLGERLAVAGQLGLEGGRAGREGGTVRDLAAHVGAGVALEMLPPGRFTLQARLMVSAVYLYFEGDPGDDGYRGGSSQGVSGQALLEVSPGVRLGAVRLMLPIQGGYLTENVRAVVEGDANVVAGGWWLGVEVRVELRVGGAPQ